MCMWGVAGSNVTSRPSVVGRVYIERREREKKKEKKANRDEKKGGGK